MKAKIIRYESRPGYAERVKPVKEITDAVDDTKSDRGVADKREPSTDIK